MPKIPKLPDPLEIYPLWKRVEPKLRLNMQIGLLLDDNARLQRAALTNRMEHYGATYKQWYALSQISRKDGMTQTEIGELLEVTKGACTTLIDRLIKNDWVERKQCVNDRRQQLIFLTRKGRSLVNYEIDFLSDTYVEIFSALSKRDRAVLVDFLLSIREKWGTVIEREKE